MRKPLEAENDLPPNPLLWPTVSLEEVSINPKLRAPAKPAADIRRNIGRTIRTLCSRIEARLPQTIAPTKSY